MDNQVSDKGQFMALTQLILAIKTRMGGVGTRQTKAIHCMLIHSKVVQAMVLHNESWDASDKNLGLPQGVSLVTLLTSSVFRLTLINYLTIQPCKNLDLWDEICKIINSNRSNSMWGFFAKLAKAPPKVECNLETWRHEEHYYYYRYTTFRVCMTSIGLTLEAFK